MTEVELALAGLRNILTDFKPSLCISGDFPLTTGDPSLSFMPFSRRLGVFGRAAAGRPVAQWGSLAAR